MLRRSLRRVASGGALWCGIALAMGGSRLHPVPASTSCHGDAPGTVVRQVRGPDDTITMILFDYQCGMASRVVVAAKSGQVLSNDRLPGRPQSSRAEFREAVRLIGRDARLTGLLARGAVPEGGFIVDGPPGSPDRHRYVQIRLLTPDRRDLLKVALVDLTAGDVATARDSFE
jgi:hypothetical protein